MVTRTRRTRGRYAFWSRPVPAPNALRGTLRRESRVAFSADGERLAAWQLGGHAVHVWKTQNGTALTDLDTGT